jgi:putative transcriptional regulator
MNNNLLTNNIKVLRIKKKLTQEDLANLCKCTRQTINAIEKNKYSPSLVLAFKIAIKLESEITEVFEYNIMDNN